MGTRSTIKRELVNSIMNDNEVNFNEEFKKEQESYSMKSLVLPALIVLTPFVFIFVKALHL